MVNVTNLILSITKPTGMWESILDWLEKAIVNYGWVIIVFTLLVKLCLTPLDFLIRFSSKKSTLVQRKLAPQIARINKKYANDKNQAQLQTNALYKKEGFNVFGSCIIMLINLAVTMTVFLTLFNALRVESAYKAISQYEAMEVAYTQSYNGKLSDVKS
ncbi:MAG: YidC/Oxa1 family membrane protein insertase, partial [Clostridia bacterium]|nr:YidC/Oxa1 family membrane protein insertase [Clostridia bacterium]